MSAVSSSATVIGIAVKLEFKFVEGGTKSNRFAQRSGYSCSRRPVGDASLPEVLSQTVYFDQSDAGAAVLAGQDRGVGAG